MKIYKSILSVVLALSVFISTTVISNAAEGQFIAVDVVEYDEYGDQTVKTHAFYTDGKHLYSSINTLEKYTFYDYDEQNSAFVRTGQDYSLSLSKTTLDFEKKKATVKMLNGEKEYNLHDVIKFGDEYYLPLDQMSAFLMASISFTNNKLTIRNSGFSIADAAYKFNNFSYVFNYDDIVDGIFAGNENLYFKYCVIGYLGSTIFGLRIKNLDIINNSGDTEYYQDFLQNCITDYDEYLKTQAETDSFEKRLNDALSLEEGLNGLISILKNGTTISKTAYETFIDTSDIANLDIEYIDLKNWNGVFDGLSTSLDYMEYFTKAASMTEDHKLMIRECNKDATINNVESQLKTAITNNFHQFGENAFTTILSKIAETLIEETPGEVIKKFGATIVPYIAIIKAVNLAFKLLGYDLSDNSQYSIMLAGSANSYLAGRYSVLENDAGKTKESSEKFRRSAIFMLLASKNAYEAGNELDKKLEGSGTLFNDEIEEVCARLNLFYRAAESSCYENIESVDGLIEKNSEAISESNIIDVSSTISSPNDSIIQLTNYNARKYLEDAIRCYTVCSVNNWYGIEYDENKPSIYCQNSDNPNYSNITTYIENESGEWAEVYITDDYLVTNYKSSNEIIAYVDEYLTDGMEDYPQLCLKEYFEYGIYYECAGRIYFCPHIPADKGWVGYDLSSIEVLERRSDFEYLIAVDEYSSAGFYDHTDRMIVKNVNGVFKISMVIYGEYGDEYYKHYISSDYAPPDNDLVY